MENAWERHGVRNAESTGYTSAEAEASLIACFIISRDTLVHVDEISDDDFSQDVYRKIFTVVRELKLANKPVDLITIDDMLMARYASEEHNLIMACVECTRILPTSANCNAYVEIVKSLSQRRRALAVVSGIYQELKDAENETGAVVEKARQSLRDLVTTSHKWQNMSSVMLETYQFIEDRAMGRTPMIQSGLSNVDSAIGGFFAGEMTLIGARPGVGKSAFGANIAIKAAQNGFKVGICSREMTDVQFGQRMMSYASNVDGMKLRKGTLENEDWEPLCDAMSYCAQLPISFLFTVRTIEDLRAEVQAKADKGELDLLIVDYLQLVQTQQKIKEEYLKLGYISKALKDLAVDLKIAVIALAQVNRDTDGQMPTLKSLRGSGDMEQDADGVIFLHKPDSAEDPYVDPRDKAYFNDIKGRGLQYIAFGIAKQRQGVTGKACAIFDPAHMRYHVIDRGRDEAE